MSIGIEFILKTNSAQFTKGIASANNSLESLKKNLRHGDVGNGIKRLLGAGAIIEGFKIAISHAQELRTNLESMGKSVPDTIASVARLGDSLKSAGDGLKDLAMNTLGFFTKAGDAIGGIINTARFGGQAGNIEKLSEQSGRGADEQEARRDAAIKARIERNTGTNLAKLTEQLKSAQDSSTQARLRDEEKITSMLQEETDLRKKIEELKSNPDTANNDTAMILGKQIELENKGKEIDAAIKSFAEKQASSALEKKDAERTLKDAQEKLLDSKRDRFLPTIAGLAQSQKFGENDARSVAIEHARQLARLEEQAGFSAGRGDINAAVALQGQAEKLRAGLGGFAKSEEVNRSKEQVEAVDKATDQLKQVNEKLSSIFVVKK